MPRLRTLSEEQRGALHRDGFLIAYSRVYLGVHYPLDVVAGGIAGITCAIGVWRLSLGWGVRLWRRTHFFAPVR